jgi:hypothetical protein
LGQYKRVHDIKVFGINGWVPTKVTDTLVLTPASDGKVEFNFVLNHENGHTCWMQGNARQANRYLEYRESLQELLNENAECVLRIRVSPQVISLEDKTSLCTRIYCGVRGYIDGISFPRNAN